MRRVLVDTNVFVYARGVDHPYRTPCRDLLGAARDGLVMLEASVEVVQEFTHLLLRRGIDRAAALEEATEVRSQCRLHAFDEDVMSRALALLGRHQGLGARDAVHAATALRVGLRGIVSTDRVFDDVDEIERVDPSVADRLWQPS